MNMKILTREIEVRSETPAKPNPTKIDVKIIVFCHEKNRGGLYKHQGWVSASHICRTPSWEEERISSLSNLHRFENFKPLRFKLTQEKGRGRRDDVKPRENGHRNGVTKERERKRVEKTMFVDFGSTWIRNPSRPISQPNLESCNPCPAHAPKLWPNPF